MLYINKITADPYQQITLTGIPNLLINMTLQFMPRNTMWTMSLAVGNFSLFGSMVVASPNMIRQFKNNIGFGIACTSADGLDPTDVNDFANQTANLYLLNADDVVALEAGLFT